jgi:hypothetical protein
LDIVYGKHKEEEKLLGEEQKERKFMEKIRNMHLRVQELLKNIYKFYKDKHDHHRDNHNFHVGDQVWFYLYGERMQGSSKKPKPLRYGIF